MAERANGHDPDPPSSPGSFLRTRARGRRGRRRRASSFKQNPARFLGPGANTECVFPNYIESATHVKL
jgi:hypothetical protein